MYFFCFCVQYTMHLNYALCSQPYVCTFKKGSIVPNGVLNGFIQTRSLWFSRQGQMKPIAQLNASQYNKFVHCKCNFHLFHPAWVQSLSYCHIAYYLEVDWYWILMITITKVGSIDYWFCFLYARTHTRFRSMLVFSLTFACMIAPLCKWNCDRVEHIRLKKCASYGYIFWEFLLWLSLSLLFILHNGVNCKS